MIKYITQNNILSLFLIINIITAHIVICILNDLIVPLIYSIITKSNYEYQCQYLLIKLLIWVILLLFCKYNNINF